MNDFVWKRLKEDLIGLSVEEVNWRPLPQANNINLIVRHLRIEAEWQVASLEHGEPMPIETTESVQRLCDSIGFDYERNFKELDDLCTRFVDILRKMDEPTLIKHSESVYAALVTVLGRPAPPPHLLSFHHPMHLSQHWGQIRTIRTLYRKTRGESVPERFYPDNPSYPH